MNSKKQSEVSLFLFLLVVPLSFPDDPFKTCNRYTSFGYGYRDFFEFRNGNYSLNQVFYLEFYVKTVSDAHVFLKPDVSVEDGYEIVIGAASNTFSQIRILESETKKSVMTKKTENFLSGEDYRKFWISIDNLGIISVGQEEDEVFMNWRLDNPQTVKYFSFGSWTNVKADWRFWCKEQINSGNTHEDESVSALWKLKRDLFTLYDPNVLPVEKNAVLEVAVNFLINNVELNEKRGEITLYGTGDLKWTDGKIKWEPENYEGIENIYVPPFQIWTPNIRVLNVLAPDRSQLFDLTASGVVAKFDGSIFWRPPFKSVSHCMVDLELWPYDAHNCSVLFGFWREPSNLVLTMMNEYEMLSQKKIASEWEIVQVVPGKEKNFGILYIDLIRAYGPQATIITVTYEAVILMTLISFWLPLHSSLKKHMIFSSIIMLLLILFAAGESVPAMTEGVPRIIKLYSWTVVVTCAQMALYVALQNIPSCVEMPELLSKILSNSAFAKIFCLPHLNTISAEYSTLDDEVNKQNEQLNSIRLAMVIERFFFLAYLLIIILLCLLI